MTPLSAGLVTLVAATLLSVPPVAAEEPPPVTATDAEAEAPADRQDIPRTDRDRVLGPGWRRSTDRAWATTGDAAGFHVLVAERSEGYAWRTVATLSEPGLMADAWIGNACVTGSGERLVVAYAPRTFMNSAELMQRGAFTAVVDLVSGEVTKLDLRASLAYFNPGCGTGESAVLVQSRGAEMSETRLVAVDAGRAKLGEPVEVSGQITSPVPVGKASWVAAAGGRLVEIDRAGEVVELVRTSGVPYGVTVDADGGIVFLDRAADRDARTRPTVAVRRLDRDQGAAGARTLAVGPLTGLGLTASADGAVAITGRPDRVERDLPGVVRRLPDALVDARLSTEGASLLNGVAWADGEGAGLMAEPGEPRLTELRLLDGVTGAESDFTVLPSEEPGEHEGEGREPAGGSVADVPSGDASPDGTSSDSASVAGTSSALSGDRRYEIVEEERYCSVPRNEPSNQPIQPKPRQVEWAVNRAVMGELNQYVSRPANWKNHGMGAYQPQTLFPSQPLLGGGRVPHQVLLGVAAQESNMRQSSWHVMPGAGGNPLIGNYYGRAYDPDGTTDWAIDWAHADCGYGVMQVTDHMRLAGREDGGLPAWPYEKQRAVALDYTVNIAAGLQILQEKWNQTRSEGLVINNGSAARPENWFFALWAYNSGYYEQANAGEHDGAWGVGWANNPANPYWKPSRTAFMDTGLGQPHYQDAATPQYWPYQEKVLGFAAYPPSLLEAPNTPVPAFRPASWNPSNGRSAEQNRALVKPPIDLFCTPEVNDCHIEKLDDDTENDENGPCEVRDANGDLTFKCWWNQPVTWKDDCAASCGYEFRRFPDGWAEEPDGQSYPPRCDQGGLPSGALIIDVRPNSVPSTRPNCSRTFWANAGTFTMDFGPGETWGGGVPLQLWPSKVDFHQIGGGFGGHFFLGHTRETGSVTGERLKATGRWELDGELPGWARVMVHIPDNGAHTQQAKYQIYNGDTLVATRHIPTRHRAHTWVNLGVFDFSAGGRPRVELANVTDDGTGADSIAWDALAFVPLAEKPDHFIVVMGDSYSSGEGAGDYSVVSDNNRTDELRWNGCRRSDNAWSKKATLRGQSENIGILAARHDPVLDFQFVACSAATAWVMQHGDPNTWGRDGQFREKSQLDSGVLNADTTLVALTIGGNDAGFAAVIEDCILPLVPCPNLEMMKANIRAAIDEAETTIRQIGIAAPNATIRLLGYPRLFSSENGCAALSDQDRDRINEAGDYMTLLQETMAVNLFMDYGTKVFFTTPDHRFEGHRSCDDEEGIHQTVAAQNGEGDNVCIGPEFCVSRESFHPNQLGTSLYGRVFEGTL
jgi:hypothetical protein